MYMYMYVCCRDLMLVVWCLVFIVSITFFFSVCTIPTGSHHSRNLLHLGLGEIIIDAGHVTDHLISLSLSILCIYIYM